MAGRETIHSGHFMTSNPHTEPAHDEEDEDVEVDVVEEDEKGSEEKGGGTKKSVPTDEKPVTFYKFGPQKTQSIAIDVSLNKLNKCIKVAYNKMTTPKWKDFKGLRLHWKQRIRLNNVIWRAYHMEFGQPKKERKKKTPYCYFAVPDDDTTHTKIEGSLLEGMYWKRRMEAVCAQYKRWRHYSKKHPHVTGSTFIPPGILAHGGKGRKRTHGGDGRSSSGCESRSFGEPPPKSQTPKNTSTEYFDIDEFENEFTDTLFDSLKEPYMFPNPKEMMQSGNADIMQPGLLSLQPSLEEIMASLIGDDQQSDFSLCGSSSTSQPPVSRVPPSDYSAKDYLAASMLLDYSQQRSPQPPRQSLSSPSYSSAGYESARHAWKASSAGAPNFTMANGSNLPPTVDYMPQFMSSTGYRGVAPLPSLPSPSPSLLCAVSPSSSRWWFEPAPLSSPRSLETPLLPPTVPRPTPVADMKLPLRVAGRDDGTDLALSALPRQTLSERLGRRSVLAKSEWTSPPSVASSTAPAELASKNPWDMEDPCSQRNPFSLSLETKEEVLEEGTSLPGNTHAKRGTKQVPADSTLHPNERKRILHLHAEQSRRHALKDGFDSLLEIVPEVDGSGCKPTNAVVLAKAAEYIKTLRGKKQNKEERASQLSSLLHNLNERISSLQNSLPASKRTTAAKSDHKSAIEHFFQRYTKERTKDDWRFWLMARLLQPVVQLYAEEMQESCDASGDEMVCSLSQWMANHWQVSKLRPLASNVLVYLATSTQMLTNPNSLKEHIEEQIK